MPIHTGSDKVKNLYLGTTAIGRAYYGDVLVYEKGDPSDGHGVTPYFEYVGSQSVNPSATATYTFTGLPVGTEFEGKWIYAFISTTRGGGYRMDASLAGDLVLDGAITIPARRFQQDDDNGQSVQCCYGFPIPPGTYTSMTISARANATSASWNIDLYATNMAPVDGGVNYLGTAGSNNFAETVETGDITVALSYTRGNVLPAAIDGINTVDRYISTTGGHGLSAGHEVHASGGSFTSNNSVPALNSLGRMQFRPPAPEDPAFVSISTAAGDNDVSGVHIGPADANRLIVVVVGNRGSAAIGSVSLDTGSGMTPLTLAVSGTGGFSNQKRAIYYGHFPTGTSATLRINTSAALSVVDAQILNIVTPLHALLDTATDSTDSTANSLSIDTEVDGYLVQVGYRTDLYPDYQAASGIRCLRKTGGESAVSYIWGEETTAAVSGRNLFVTSNLPGRSIAASFH